MGGTLHRLWLPLVFPEGLSPGEGRSGNVVAIARDGCGDGRPVLRATAVAGVLRHALARRRGCSSDDPSLQRIFGAALDATMQGPSRLKVGDAVLVVGKGPDVVRRNHIAINRHRGTVLKGALVTVEALPPGVATVLRLLLEDDGEPGCHSLDVLQEIVDCCNEGLSFGGRSARGIGRAALNGTPTRALFDLGTLEGWAAWLDEDRRWREAALAGRSERLSGTALTAQTGVGSVLRVKLDLGIPRGEDLLVADGQGLDFELEPQRVRRADGTTVWRLPGSSLRGVFRAWFARLSARADEPVADSYDRGAHKKDLNGADLAWGYAPRELRRAVARRSEIPVKCVVMDLFGSAYAKGRIQIADAFASAASGLQARSHVAVDRVTGGANDGFFFMNGVLVASSTEFSVVLTVANPTEAEAKRLAEVVRAIDLGILRVGSSKAGGRLALVRTPEASGPFAATFTALNPEGN